MLNKEKDKQLSNMELRSEEVQELMGKVPSTILFVGVFLFIFFAIALSILACYFTETTGIDIVQFIKSNAKI